MRIFRVSPGSITSSNRMTPAHDPTVHQGGPDRSVRKQDLDATPVIGGFLQRKCACGNHTVGSGECTECSKKRLGLQSKLTVDAAGSNLGNQAILRATRASSAHELSVQRKCACDGCSNCSSDIDEIKVQTKLEIDTPGDRWEMEADRIADAVVSSKSPRTSEPATRRDASVPAIPVQPLPVSIHRTAHPNANGANDSVDGVDGMIVSRLGKGAPLPASTRAFMEGHFQSDLSAVRIHTDAVADSLNTALHSYAFTSGYDVFFATGQYSPGTVEGDRLLAHELVHTVQQGASPSDSTTKLGRRSAQRNSGTSARGKSRSHYRSSDPGSRTIKKQEQSDREAAYQPSESRIC